MSHRAKALRGPEPTFKVKDYPFRVSFILRQGTWWVVERAQDLVETVAGTVDTRFGSYVSGQFAEAERRHKQRLEGHFELPRPDPVPEASLEMESRLTLLLIRCLPAELKQPVLENTDG